MMHFTGTIFPKGSSRQVAAQLAISPDAVTATTDDGQGHVLLLAGVTARMANGTLILTSADGSVTVSSSEPAFAAELRRIGSPAVAAALGELGARERRRSRRGCGCMLTGLIAVVLLCVLVYFGIVWAARASVDLIPITTDIALGDSSISSMDLGGPVLREPEVTDLIAEIVRRLEAQMTPPGGAKERYAFPLKVKVIDSEQINAFALPGGNIVVFTGLIRKAGDVDQVAGVLGHEIAHVTLRHGMQGIVRSVGTMVVVAIVFGDISSVLSQVAMSTVINGYSRDQEREADAEGARIAAAAGFDPEGIAGFFTVLKSQPGSELPGIAAVFSTHPQHDERIANARELARTLKRVEAPSLSASFAAAQRVLETGRISASRAAPR